MTDDLDNFGEKIDRLPFCLPKDITPEIFLRDYWQKKPLLIKNGLPSLVGMFEPTDVLDLAIEEGVSARLITQKDKDNNQWTLKNSPLSDFDIKNTPKLWTILVQNLEAWSPDLGQLWQAFDFIPKWQQDDIMVSVAPNGGSVGAHYDEYDVFLAQGYGQRRWQLGKFCDLDTPFVEGQPIRLLDDMGELIFDEVLQAGDVLYVPPRLSHHGIAQGDCLTFSFGFRRPNLVQILDEIADVATSHHALFSPITLTQTFQNNPNELSDDSIASVKKILIETLNSPLGNDIIKTALAELLSKRQYELLAFEDELSATELQIRLQSGECLLINAASRFVYIDGTWYVNGEYIPFSTTELSLFTRLVDGEILTYDDIDHTLLTTLSQWVNDSWVVIY